MTCKFCGCTDDRPCAIPMVTLDADDLLGRPAHLVFPGQLAEFTTPCHWSAPDICSAPACIELAYRECCEIVDELTAFLAEAAA
jgi:hypothetical protein